MHALQPFNVRTKDSIRMTRIGQIFTDSVLFEKSVLIRYICVIRVLFLNKPTFLPYFEAHKGN